jgi:hypothetical protein
MDKLRGIVNVVLLLVLLDLIFFLYIYVDYKYPDKVQILKIHPTIGSESPNQIMMNSEVKMMYPNLRFNHNNISFFIDGACDEIKKSHILLAFMIISNQTEILNFYPTEVVGADILVLCSKQVVDNSNNEVIAGEGGPVVINNSVYQVIMNGKVLLYDQISCEYPVTELHEILHVFGFEHNDNPKTIGYPYLDCKQRLDEATIKILKEAYSTEPKAELYFTNVSATKIGKYLNVGVEIDNNGIIDAKAVSFDIYLGESKIGSYGLNEITLGAGKTIYLTNLKIPNNNERRIVLNITSITPEYEYGNNELELMIPEI